MASNEQSNCFLLSSFPAELRLEVYRYILADCSDDKAQMTGALSSCQKMNMELDREMTCTLIKRIGLILKEVTTAWNKVFPPFRVTIPAHNADLK
jgi:hypothetical protein